MAGNAVLIYEDDRTQAEALRTACVRLNFEVFVATGADNANEILKSKKVRYIFVDCLLPSMSGVDFVQSIRGNFPSESLDVILMSGIFTDAAFVKDSLRATQAIAFLKKPFDIQEATKFLKAEERLIDSVEVLPRRALYSMFSRDKVTVREKRKMIESLDEIHGYDLPFIYSLLIEAKMSGHLNIAAETGDVSGISFSQGAIVAVDIADQETFLGKLLIESGFVLPDDLNQVLNIKSSKKMGERLIQGNVLSPHAFNIVMSSQMSIRLSRTIINSSVSINFVETDVEFTTPNVDSDSLLKFLHDWIAGKITLAWLKPHYLQWGSQKLELGPLFKDDNLALKMPLITSLPDFLQTVTNGQTLNELVDQQKYPEEPFYKAVHFLLTKGMLVLKEDQKARDPKDLEKQLKKIWAQFQGKNKIEVFDLMARMTNISENESAKVYPNFLKMIGEGSPSESPDTANCRKQIEQAAKESHEFFRSGGREKLKEEMAKSQIELKLKAATQFEEAKNSLQRSQYAVALQLLESAIAVDPLLDKSKILLAWAKLGLLESGGNKSGLSLKEVQMDLMQVSPEDKYDALYSFVTGLYSRASGDLLAAKKSFEKAVNMDSTMIVARRELTKTVGQSGPKKDVLNRDLKDLVSNFFGKKR
jgi:ActR/RegA family two-component response regulator/tetratricopeptide (TPR) repeat protein